MKSIHPKIATEFVSDIAVYLLLSGVFVAAIYLADGVLR